MKNFMVNIRFIYQELDYTGGSCQCVNHFRARNISGAENIFKKGI